MPPRETWERALPVDPGLDFADPQRFRAGRFVHIRSSRSPSFARRSLLGGLRPRGDDGNSRTCRCRRAEALAADRAALAVLMLSVGLAYRQVVRAYRHGGGSYIVASDSLERQWGLLAGAGLIVDYILTVAVSVASGVAAVTSAIPSVASATVPIGLVVIVLLVAATCAGSAKPGRPSPPNLPVRGCDRPNRERRSHQGRLARLSSRARGASPGHRGARRAIADQQPVHEREVQHLLGGHVRDRPPPAFDGGQLVLGQPLV